MNHNEVFKMLKEFAPFYAAHTETWYPNGKNSIRLVMKDKRELVFSCEKEDGSQYCLESLSNYIKKMRLNSPYIQDRRIEKNRKKTDDVQHFLKGD